MQVLFDIKSKFYAIGQQAVAQSFQVFINLFDCCLIGSLKKTYIYTKKLVNRGFDFIKLLNYLLIVKSRIYK